MSSDVTLILIFIEILSAGARFLLDEKKEEKGSLVERPFMVGRCYYFIECPKERRHSQMLRHNLLFIIMIHYSLTIVSVEKVIKYR